MQIFHRGWDHHTQLPRRIQAQAKDVDQPPAALVSELKERGMLDDTLVIWGGEFGRTIFCQGRLTEETYGRDHHPRSFTYCLAGGASAPRSGGQPPGAATCGRLGSTRMSAAGKIQSRSRSRARQAK